MLRRPGPEQGGIMTGTQAFIEWMEARYAAVMAAERQALAELDVGDIDAYNAAMKEKATLLAGMDREAAELVVGVEDAVLRDGVTHALHRFSNSARNSLRIGSVFYMSALLYPDDHKPGEPDNLRLFIDGVRSGRLED